MQAGMLKRTLRSAAYAGTNEAVSNNPAMTIVIPPIKNRCNFNHPFTFFQASPFFIFFLISVPYWNQTSLKSDITT